MEARGKVCKIWWRVIGMGKSSVCQYTKPQVIKRPGALVLLKSGVLSLFEPCHLSLFTFHSLLVYCRLESGQSRKSMIWSRPILRRRAGRASDGSEATLICTALLAVAVRVLAIAWIMYEPGGAGLP